MTALRAARPDALAASLFVAMLVPAALSPGRAGGEDVEASAPGSLPSYYARRAVEDSHGVIAPWHAGQNGACDERLRIAVELFKRYPWVGADRAVLAAPHLVYNTHWRIAPDGAITIPPTHPWMCGDLSQRALSIIQGLTRYYAYSGDPLAFVYVPLTVDYILDHCLTGPDHDWPLFPVSTPTRGLGYGKADPAVANQLDLCAYLGLEVLRAHRLTGNPRYLEAAKRWGELIATKCNRSKDGLPPWNRYVSPEHKLWSDELTGGVTLIVEYLDALIDAGFTGRDGIIVKARDAGRDYLTRDLLPRWTENEVWGRHYWDMEGAIFCGVVPWICEHFLDHPDAFPSWRTDVRNILSLVFNRNCVDPISRGGMYSGAWAFPESSLCCGTSLSYNQYTYAPAFLRYGELAGDEWAREIGRRMLLMALYDSTDTGVVLDGLPGEVVAAGEWLNLAHPWPLCQILKAFGAAPEILAPSRENHILRCSSVVRHVVYDKGLIEYGTSDAPPGVQELLRLSFEPTRVLAGGRRLERRADLEGSGYVLRKLDDGDCLVTIRHDGAPDVRIEGDDPQEVVEDGGLDHDGRWTEAPRPEARGGTMHVATEAGAAATVEFAGNQVRVVGSVGPEGGLADVVLDGERQLTLVDCWSPSPRHRQVLYRRSGLANGRHVLRIVARGEGRPVSAGTAVEIDAIQFSSAAARPQFGEGGGPMGTQRMIFGYTEREDHVDSKGQAWRPGEEFVVRLGYGADSVAGALYTERRCIEVEGTADPELYRHGLHGKDLTVNLTVGPGPRYVKMLFAETGTGSILRAWINGAAAVEELDVGDAAGGKFRALDLAFPGIRPVHGAIQIRLVGLKGKEACLQALEVGPCEEGAVRLVYRAARELLRNGDFEADLGRVPGPFAYVQEGPAGWDFREGRAAERGLQNIEPFGGGKVGAWLGAGEGMVQVLSLEGLEKGARHRLRARARGKGKQGAAASTSAGNRIGATLYWTRDPAEPFRGRDGEGWGRLIEASAAIAADDVWQDLEAEWSGEAPAAATHLVVEGWHRQGAGTADAYGYFDAISLVRKGGLVRAE